MRKNLHHFLPALTSLILMLAGTARADEKKVDPSGSWTWSVTSQNGDTRQTTLKLKLEGEKLTGTISGRNNETAITEGKLKDDQISFQIVRERDGNKLVQNYAGTLSGDTIKGKVTFGENRSRDWEAKREGGKGKEATNLTGKWKYTFTRGDGQTMDAVLNLKQESDKLTGKVSVNDRESDIQEGKITNGDVSFKTTRERDGQTFTSKYNGRLENDVFKGKVNSNFGGTDRTYDIEAKRVKE